MPSDLTIFGAEKLVYVEAVLGIAVIALLLYRRHRLAILQWAVAVAIMLLLSYVFGAIGGVVYNDPRPFAVDRHLHPLILHSADNGFPSDHALLAAAIVAAVLLVSPAFAVPFAILAFLVDWARVGAGIHHVDDVVGSSLFVAAATAVASLFSPRVTRWLARRLPARLIGKTPASSHPMEKA